MTMNAIRVQVHLKYIFDESLPKQFHNFWYAFEPANLLTINELIEDIQLNYLKNQVPSSVVKDQKQKFIVHLDDCELLPFSSSKILRDNDRLTLMPLTKYRLEKKSFRDSTTLCLNVSVTNSAPLLSPLVSHLPQSETPLTFITTAPTSCENSHKRKRVKSIEQSTPIESTVNVTQSDFHVDELLSKKKITDKPSAAETIATTIIAQSTHEPQIPHAKLLTSIVSKELNIKGEADGKLSESRSSIVGHLREIKSKTPTWKSQAPMTRGSPQDKTHVRFDSESDDEISTSQVTTMNKPSTFSEVSMHIDNSYSSSIVHSVPMVTTTDVSKTSDDAKDKKKTVDLLFEMKQHKTAEERRAKQIQNQFSRKRSQNRKRALACFSLSGFVDKAFGLDKVEIENQKLSDEFNNSPQIPQVMPTSFNKLARLPLVAEAIENNDKMYDLYPPVTEYPPVQTRIAFKLLELSEDFCPKMSAFKEGTVTDVNQTTGELTIQFDKPLQTVFDQPSKFYTPPEEVSELDKATIVLPFSNLNAVRLLSASNSNIAT